MDGYVFALQLLSVAHSFREERTKVSRVSCEDCVYVLNLGLRFMWVIVHVLVVDYNADTDTFRYVVDKIVVM